MYGRTDVQAVEEEWDCSTLNVEEHRSTGGTMYRSTRRNILEDLALPHLTKTSNLTPISFVSLRFQADMNECKI
jgi:hypothetical protein